VALPLEGVVVADLTQNVAGPFCTQILGDMGADVIKVERPGRGDDARAWAPPYWGAESATFMSMNRNKRSLALDLKRQGGLEVLRRLVGRADVLVQSLRAGALAELGLDFAGARAVNGRLVYCSITAFGTRGPLRDLPGYDPMMQAYAGLMSVNGHPGQEPARVGTSIVDMGTGMWAALGIVAALRQVEATGRAVEVTTALFDTTLMWVSYHAMGYMASGEVPRPQGSGTAMIAPYQAFATADGYAMIAAGSDALFARLCEALGAPDLAGDPRFADNPSRVRHREPLAAALSALTREHKTADLLEALRRGGVVDAPHPRAPGYRSIGLPIQWDGRRPGVRRVPPLLGQDGEDVLTWLGYTLDDVRGLRARGVLA
jgi:crotonobetainyl-CoA:carnitine CoA-transferase CaiB-like acyl-CoA transferase